MSDTIVEISKDSFQYRGKTYPSWLDAMSAKQDYENKKRNEREQLG